MYTQYTHSVIIHNERIESRSLFVNKVEKKITTYLTKATQSLLRNVSNVINKHVHTEILLLKVALYTTFLMTQYAKK